MNAPFAPNALAGELAARASDRPATVAILKAALAAGRAQIAAALAARPGDGRAATAAYAALTDEIVTHVHTHVTAALLPSANRTAAEQVSLLAVGGYGRGEMAPFSDVDLLFLTPHKVGGWAEQRIETMLYLLWDSGLKIGHAVRSVGETVHAARGDMSIRTGLLERRLVAGDLGPAAALDTRFETEFLRKSPAEFAIAKLAERDARHLVMGDSRYVTQPNVKEGKGALRDLHALRWIARHAFGAPTLDGLVQQKVLTPGEIASFRRAERFLLAVRCHLHLAAGRAEERLSFDLQREVAQRMNFASRPGKSNVERFMQLYFRNARAVGALSGAFFAQVDERFAAKGFRLGLPQFLRRPGKLEGFVLERGRIALPHSGFFREEPLRLLQIFALADAHGLELHPSAMRQATRDVRLVDAALRDDRRANALFLDIMTSPRSPDLVLRWMNEAGVLGRFLPDFGRIVAQMQFDMYHHYTVDEHTIRAIGLLARIERGDLKEDHPLSTALFRQLASRRVLYVAVLLHDIAKGRGGDHSLLGAEVAARLCPRLGLSPAETETVAWLVRHHLLLSATAFKRDLADLQTVADFAAAVQSPERLRLLLILTVVDIRAVGPGTWNGWKRDLLRILYEATEERLRLGHKQRGRGERVAERRAALAAELGWGADLVEDRLGAMPEAYWLAEPLEVQAANACQIAAAEPVRARVDGPRAATLVSVLAPDSPGLLHRLVTAISAAGGNIIDARVHTASAHDGAGPRALDNFLVQDGRGGAYCDDLHLDRLLADVAAAIDGAGASARSLQERRPARPETGSFRIEPSVLVNNGASSRYTVVEVNAADRPALLSDLAAALLAAGAALHSAHIATYGERAVDVFYLTGGEGAKITNPGQLATLTGLLEAAAGS